jgi:hypothetical protein
MAATAARSVVAEAQINERRRQVAALYLAHQSLHAIARQVGMSVGTVCEDLKALKQAWREESRFDVAQIMEREILELDEMEAEAVRQYSQSKDGRWFERRLKVKERRSRMLGFEASVPPAEPTEAANVVIREVIVNLQQPADEIETTAVVFDVPQLEGVSTD